MRITLTLSIDVEKEPQEHHERESATDALVESTGPQPIGFHANIDHAQHLPRGPGNGLEHPHRLG